MTDQTLVISSQEVLDGLHAEQERLRDENNALRRTVKDLTEQLIRHEQLVIDLAGGLGNLARMMAEFDEAQAGTQ